MVLEDAAKVIVSVMVVFCCVLFYKCTRNGADIQDVKSKRSTRCASAVLVCCVGVLRFYPCATWQDENLVNLPLFHFIVSKLYLNSVGCLPTSQALMDSRKPVLY